MLLGAALAVAGLAGRPGPLVGGLFAVPRRSPSARSRVKGACLVGGLCYRLAGARNAPQRAATAYCARKSERPRCSCDETGMLSRLASDMLPGSVPSRIARMIWGACYETFRRLLTAGSALTLWYLAGPPRRSASVTALTQHRLALPPTAAAGESCSTPCHPRSVTMDLTPGPGAY